MKNFEIKISGSGTPNQLAIRLLELGRKLQIQDAFEEFDDNFLNEINESNDGCLEIEIKL